MTRRMVGGDPQPVHQRARATAPAGWSRATAAPAPQSQFDARGGLRGLRRARRRGRDQLPSRAPRPADELLELARDLGCLFSIDSDAHAPGQLDFLATAASAPRRPASTPDRIVNTWPRDRLLAWARGDTSCRSHGLPCGRPLASRHAARGGGAPLPRRRRTVSAYREGDKDRGADPRPLHPRRGGRVGRDRCWPGSSRPEAPAPAHRRRPDAARAARSADDYLDGLAEPAVGALGRQPAHPLGLVHARRPHDPALARLQDDAGLGGRLRARPRARPPARAGPQRAVLAWVDRYPRPSGPRATSRATRAAAAARAAAGRTTTPTETPDAGPGREPRPARRMSGSSVGQRVDRPPAHVERLLADRVRGAAPVRRRGSARRGGGRCRAGRRTRTACSSRCTGSGSRTQPGEPGLLGGLAQRRRRPGCVARLEWPPKWNQRRALRVQVEQHLRRRSCASTSAPAVRWSGKQARHRPSGWARRCVDVRVAQRRPGRGVGRGPAREDGERVGVQAHASARSGPSAAPPVAAVEQRRAARRRSRRR